MKIDLELFGKRLLERGFRDWFLFFFKETEGQDFVIEPIHKDLFRCFQDIYDGKSTRQIINIPPRAGKSTMAIYFIAYALAKNMKCNFIYTSFSQELLSTNCRRLACILNSKMYVEMYLGSNLTQEQEVQDTVTDDFWKEYYKLKEGLPTDAPFKFSNKQITTSSGGVVLFNSIGSSITGYGAGLVSIENQGFGGSIIIDDANKPIEAHSKKIRDKVKTYFEETLLSRLNNSKTPIINIQQRLHIEDLSGFLLKNYDFQILKKPLLIDGVCQIPHQYNEKRIEELKKNNFLFLTQYQQEPIQKGGSLIKTDWFKRYEIPEEMYRLMYIVCDTAFSTKTSADNSAFMLVGITNDNDLYILDMQVGKMDFVTLKKNLKNFYKRSLMTYGRYNVISSIYIENKASGQSLIQELRSEKLPISELSPTAYNKSKGKETVTDKYTRFLEISTQIESGCVFIPDTGGWVNDFLSECEAFDGLGSTKDDMIDCLIYALKVKMKSFEIDWGASLKAFL